MIYYTISYIKVEPNTFYFYLYLVLFISIFTFFQISLSVRDQESPTGEEASLHPTWTTRNLNQGIMGTKQGPAGLIEEINHQPKKSNHSQHSRRDHPRRSVPGPYRDPQTRYKLEISQIFLWENSETLIDCLYLDLFINNFSSFRSFKPCVIQNPEWGFVQDFI